MRRLEERKYKSEGYLSTLMRMGPDWIDSLKENKGIKKGT